MDQVRLGDLTFDITDSGPSSGELVVLLHGYPETRASWSAVIPPLVEAGYRVVAPDQRGYSPGARPAGRRAYRMELLVGDVIGMIDAVGAGQAHVVGHDWGGAVAWATAGRFPDRILTMTSLATPHPRAMQRALVTSTQALHSWYLLFYQLPWLPEMGMVGAGRRLFRRTLRRSGLPESSIDTYLSVLGQPGAATASINWYRALPFSGRPDAQPVEVPVLYVYGTADFALGRKAAELTGRFVKGPYRYEVLDGVSHWIPEEVPAVVSGLLSEHFRDHGGRDKR